jgi:hypothetical protein
VGEEPNHTTRDKAQSSINHSILWAMTYNGPISGTTLRLLAIDSDTSNVGVRKVASLFAYPRKVR